MKGFDKLLQTLRSSGIFRDDSGKFRVTSSPLLRVFPTLLHLIIEKVKKRNGASDGETDLLHKLDNFGGVHVFSPHNQNGARWIQAPTKRLHALPGLVLCSTVRLTYIITFIFCQRKQF